MEMENDRARKLALVVLCINLTLILLGALLAWRSQRAAAVPAVPTNLARVVADGPSFCAACLELRARCGACGAVHG